MADRGETRLTNEVRDALEVLLASRYRAWLDFPVRFRLSDRDLKLIGDYGAMRRRVLAAHPTVDAARLAAAERTAAPFIEEALRQRAPRSVWMIPTLLVGVLWSFAMASLVVSLAFRSSMIRMSGLEVVTAGGEPAGRVRLVTRSLLMWSPILIAGLAQSFAIGMQLVPGVVSLVGDRDHGRRCDPVVDVAVSRTSRSDDRHLGRPALTATKAALTVRSPARSSARG